MGLGISVTLAFVWCSSNNHRTGRHIDSRAIHLAYMVISHYCELSTMSSTLSTRLSISVLDTCIGRARASGDTNLVPHNNEDALLCRLNRLLKISSQRGVQLQRHQCKRPHDASTLRLSLRNVARTKLRKEYAGKFTHPLDALRQHGSEAIVSEYWISLQEKGGTWGKNKDDEVHLLRSCCEGLETSIDGLPRVRRSVEDSANEDSYVSPSESR